MTKEKITCELCQEADPTEQCDHCGNDLCEDCLEDHQHCIDCGGTGLRTYNVLRDEFGNIDYLHGTPCGETDTELCRKCEETGLRL